MRFHVGDTKGGDSSWWLYGDNDEMIAWAGETFDSTSNAKRAAESFKASEYSAQRAAANVRDNAGTATGPVMLSRYGSAICASPPVR